MQARGAVAGGRHAAGIPVEIPVIGFLGLGANVDEPESRVRAAIRELDALSQIEVLASSSLYQSDPMGPQDQPPFINAVVKIGTSLSATDLLIQTQALESRHGRRHGGRRWGERPLDVDILLLGELQMNEEALTIPHPGIRYRSFVLLPLLEIDPDIEIPGLGAGAGLLDTATDFGIRRLPQNPGPAARSDPDKTGEDTA